MVHSHLRQRRILGAVSGFIMRQILAWYAICAWRTSFPIPASVRNFSNLISLQSWTKSYVGDINKELHGISLCYCCTRQWIAVGTISLLRMRFSRMMKAYLRESIFSVRLLIVNGTILVRDLLVLSYLILSYPKEIPNGFPCLDNVIQTRGMLRDCRKRESSVFSFSKVEQHPSVSIRVSKHGKPLSNSFIK